MYYRLEIKSPLTINNCAHSCERKAIPLTQTWESRCICISEDKQVLINVAEKLSLDCFYDRKRDYCIEYRKGPVIINLEDKSCK